MLGMVNMLCSNRLFEIIFDEPQHASVFLDVCLDGLSHVSVGKHLAEQGMGSLAQRTHVLCYYCAAIISVMSKLKSDRETVHNHMI